ncbi:hypothetical protein [Rhodococcus sp. JS3073]|uniref:hypothetical protein n=1 Tax=Rhodococcus sp. JS3073 TaxID=3002901 RepID=UPI0022853DA3|nr:hypothetical protein [Rhodococcus sp. JS3073]WAM19486.1 hypothetical protein OYT95_44335 [Rhodococcus sp. JS3073]
MNKNVIRAVIASVAAGPVIVLGSGVAAAAPTLEPDGRPAVVGTVLRTDGLPMEGWTCTVSQGFTVGMVSDPDVNTHHGKIVDPLFGAWTAGPVNGACMGTGGITFPSGVAG